jgi:hypothetical protein
LPPARRRSRSASIAAGVRILSIIEHQITGFAGCLYNRGFLENVTRVYPVY